MEIADAPNALGTRSWVEKVQGGGEGVRETM